MSVVLKKSVCKVLLSFCLESVHSNTIIFDEFDSSNDNNSQKAEQNMKTYWNLPKTSNSMVYEFADYYRGLVKKPNVGSNMMAPLWRIQNGGLLFYKNF